MLITSGSSAILYRVCISSSLHLRVLTMIPWVQNIGSWSQPPWFHPLLIPFLIKELHNYNWMITFSQTCTEQNTQHNNFNWFPQGTRACNPCCCTQGAGWMVRVGNVCVWPNFWCQSKLGRNISKNIATKSLSSWQILIDKTCVTTFTTLTKTCHSIPLPSTVRISLKHQMSLFTCGH